MVLLRDGLLDKFNIERKGDRHEVGAIFRGKIQNLEPGLKAAFVDIGQEKNAFLHYWDILVLQQSPDLYDTRSVRIRSIRVHLLLPKIRSIRMSPDLYEFSEQIF